MNQWWMNNYCIILLYQVTKEDQIKYERGYIIISGHYPFANEYNLTMVKNYVVLTQKKTP